MCSLSGTTEDFKGRPPVPAPPPLAFSAFSFSSSSASSIESTGGSTSVISSFFSSRRILRLPWGSKLLRAGGVASSRTGGGGGKRTGDRATRYEHLARAPPFHEEDREEEAAVLSGNVEGRRSEKEGGRAGGAVLGRRSCFQVSDDSSTADGSVSATSSFPPSSSVVSASTHRSSSESRCADGEKFFRGGRGARHPYRMIASQHPWEEGQEGAGREVMGRSLSKRGSFSDVEPSSPPSTPDLLERSLSAVAVIKRKQEGRWEDGAFAYEDGGEGHLDSCDGKKEQKASNSPSNLGRPPPLIALRNVLVVEETPRETGERREGTAWSEKKKDKMVPLAGRE